MSTNDGATPQSGVGRFLVTHFEDTICVIAFILLIAFITIQILTRFIEPLSAIWTEEMSRYLFLIIVFMGAAASVQSRQHISIDLFATNSAPIRMSLLIIQTAAQLAFAVITIWVSAQYTYSQYQAGGLLLSISLPRWILLAFVPAALILYLIRTVVVFVEQFNEIRRGDPSSRDF